MTKEFQYLYDNANKAGQEAANALIPRGMVVSGGGIHEFVADGVCGFAWVNIKPGNCAFSNWLKKNNLARSDSYEGGVCIWISDYNQSMQKKEAHAGAFAKVIREAGFRCYSASRLD